MELKDFVANASSHEIELAFEELKNVYLPQSELVDSFNSLANNATEALNYLRKNENHHIHNARYRLNFEDASAYLASSTLLHSFDGWIYMSNAIDALAKGDVGVCVHLAYYAELRASMSFLASEGIGVFQDQHLIVKPNKSIQLEDKLGGTHQFVWSAIQEWSNSSSINSLKLLNVFSVGGHTFDEWSINFHPRVTTLMSNAIVQDWLRKWNFDVKSFRDDRGLRGEVSYRPQRMLNLDQANIKDVIGRIIEFWKVIEPGQTERFELLDKYLLGILLRQLYKELVEKHSIAETYEDLVEITISRLGLNQSISLKTILNGGGEPTLIKESKLPSFEKSTGIINPTAIIARSTLMLRLSTGIVANLLRNSSIKHLDLKFWCDKVGIENGFWESNGCPNDFIDLWPKVEENIQEVADWLADHSGTSSLSLLNDNVPYSMIILKQFHRAGLWGLSV